MNFALDFLNVESEDNIYALWLTTYESVISLYEGKEGHIDKYPIPGEEEFLVISDLKDEGILFVFKK